MAKEIFFPSGDGMLGRDGQRTDGVSIESVTIGGARYVSIMHFKRSVLSLTADDMNRLAVMLYGLSEDYKTPPGPLSFRPGQLVRAFYRDGCRFQPYHGGFKDNTCKVSASRLAVKPGQIRLIVHPGERSRTYDMALIAPYEPPNPT